MSQAGGIGFRFSTSGIEQTLETLEKFAHVVDEAADQLMEDFARQIYRKSQEYVPVHDPARRRPHHIEGGSLKRSGVVFRGENLGEWVVGYGGPGDATGQPGQEKGMAAGRDPYYAVYVHEIESYLHDPGKRWKYLEAATEEVKPDLIREAGAKFTLGLQGVARDRGGDRYAILAEDKYEPREGNILE